MSIKLPTTYRDVTGQPYLYHSELTTVHCSACGSSWFTRNRRWLPIRLSWRKLSSWGRHGFEVGNKRFSETFFATVVGLGKLVIIFGDCKIESVPVLDINKLLVLSEVEDILK